MGRLIVPTIVSGGQTGVDRGALWAAITMQADHWGWCPNGRRSEDGKVPAVFNMMETPESAYWQRTEWNVRDTDATLILAPSETLIGGTKQTMETAERLGKLCWPFATDETGTAIRSIPAIMWLLEKHNIASLNVAGPRASKWPRAYDAAFFTITDLIWQIRQEIDKRVPF